MITEEHILELATQQSFDRGMNYYLSGTIFDQRHQKNILTYSEYPGYKALHEVMDEGLSKMKHSR